MTLLQKNAALDESIKEQGLLRADAGRKSRAIGDLFEQWILRGCDWYWDKENVYFIEKHRNPCARSKHTETGGKASSSPFT